MTTRDAIEHDCVRYEQAGICMRCSALASEGRRMLLREPEFAPLSPLAPNALAEIDRLRAQVPSLAVPEDVLRGDGRLGTASSTSDRTRDAIELAREHVAANEHAYVEAEHLAVCRALLASQERIGELEGALAATINIAERLQLPYSTEDLNRPPRPARTG